jgi:uncharacterized protein
MREFCFFIAAKKSTRDGLVSAPLNTKRRGSFSGSLGPASAVLFVVVSAAPAGVVSAQTVLQSCLGIVPGQQPKHPFGPSPATMSSCRQLPGWALYEQAGQRFQAGDHAGAAKLALQAAEAGNPIAQARVATMYAHGDGVQANAAAALHWMQVASAGNEPSAENELAFVYEYGRTGRYAGYGVPDNWDLAAKLWQQSASQGLSSGEFSLGRAYEYGIGVPLNLQQAIVWYEKAAAQGHAQAAYFARYLRDNHGMDGTSRDDDERALLGPLLGRTVPFTPPVGVTFHHLEERLAYVKGEFTTQERAKATANYNMRAREYRQCMDARATGCVNPGPPPK